MKIDYIIVGQGIAGTMLAHFLLQAGQRIVIFDPGHQGTASKVAAGLINPITGRRFVKSWRIDDLLPFAKKTYADLEQLLNSSLVHPRRVIRALAGVKEENDWLTRCGDPAYRDYILEEAELGHYRMAIRHPFGYGEVREGIQVDISRLVTTYRKLLIERGLLRNEQFDHRALKGGASISYKGLVAGGVIFCEGHRAKFNPFFSYLPFHGDKGQVLLVSIKAARFEKCLKNKIFIIPLEGDLYWIGATYEKNYDHELPDERGKAFLIQQLEALLKVPFEVVDHRAAVRPTVKDRRPFVGQHPNRKGLYLFNGMGTKGTSLAPYWAKHFADYLICGQSLDPQVDIRRFGYE